jgi:hypothetical protein
MSTTSILYYEGWISKPVDKETFSILKTDDGVRSHIINYQSMQTPYMISELLRDVLEKLSLERDLKKEYGKIDNSIKKGEPIVSSIRWYDIKENVVGSHAVVAYSTYDVSDSIKNVVVYDPNSPGMARVIQFDLDNNKIMYEHYSYSKNHLLHAKYIATQIPLISASDGKKVLTAIIQEFEKAIVKKLDDKKLLGLFFQCPINITVVDQYGRIINDDGTNEIPDAKIDNIGDLKMFLLPVDLNYTVNINAYDSGNFSFTQINPLTNESASVISFKDVSITENTKAMIDVGSANPECMMQIDYDGDGTTDETKEPDTIDTIIVDTKPPVIHTVMLNTTTPDAGNNILVTVNATDNSGVTSVEANGITLTHQGENIWNGTITAIKGTHHVNVSASDAVYNVGWNNSTSYTTAAPVWHLHNNSAMYRTTTNPTGNLTIETGSSNLWIADEPAQTNLTFPAGIWTGRITLETALASGQNFSIEVGNCSDGNFTGSGSDTINGDGNTTFDFQITADLFSISTDDYLAVNITNTTTDLKVKTGGAHSHITAPDNAPAYPVPELPSIFLLASGLLMLAGFMRKRW